MTVKSRTDPPTATPWLQRGFVWYCRRLVRRSFSAMAVDARELDIDSLTGRPLIIYANHPSWWDPILAVLLHEAVFPERKFFAPIDADALEKYQVFRKLGFYGVGKSRASSAAFLEVSRSILETHDAVLWLTPEGRFTDPRDHSAPLMPGLGHLCVRHPTAAAIPLALEYPFWNERRPYMLMKLGGCAELRDADGAMPTKSVALERLTDELRAVQARLAEQVIARSLEGFRVLIASKTGPGNAYDLGRAAKALLSGKRVDLRHEP